MSKVVCGLILCGIMASGCFSKKERQTEVVQQDQVNEYPDIQLTFENGGTLATRELKENNIFIFFQPDCDHCQMEAISIEQRLEEFRDYTLYFISSSSMESILAFAESFGLHEKANVKFAWASTESVLNHYGPIQTPSVYIYSRGKLVKYFNGQTDVQNILDAL